MRPLLWKNNHLRKINHCGFTLLEVLLSISILAVGILAVGSMQIMSIKGNAHANQVTKASIVARDRVERLMAMTYTTATMDTGLTQGTYQDENPPTGYTINWEITNGCASGCDTPLNTKLIEVTVAHNNLGKDIVLVDIKPIK